MSILATAAWGNCRRPTRGLLPNGADWSLVEEQFVSRLALLRFGRDAAPPSTLIQGMPHVTISEAIFIYARFVREQVLWEVAGAEQLGDAQASSVCASMISFTSDFSMIRMSSRTLSMPPLSLGILARTDARCPKHSIAAIVLPLSPSI